MNGVRESEVLTLLVESLLRYSSSVLYPMGDCVLAMMNPNLGFGASYPAKAIPGADNVIHVFLHVILQHKAPIQ